MYFNSTNIGWEAKPVLGYYSSVEAVASSMLCTGTPTAVYASLFRSAQANVAYPRMGNTAMSDAKPSDDAVSLYYKASGVERAGRHPRKCHGHYGDGTDDDQGPK